MHVVVLCPRREIVAIRAEAREKARYGPSITVKALDEVLRAATPRIGLWLDNSDLTVEQTAAAVIAGLPAAAIDQ